MIASNPLTANLLMERECCVTHALIIEDEPFVAMLLEDVLRDEGVDSTVIADCENDAIGEARRQPPEFILSDVNLLQGTGPAAVATIIDEHGSIPVLFVTRVAGRLHVDARGQPRLVEAGQLCRRGERLPRADGTPFLS